MKGDTHDLEADRLRAGDHRGADLCDLGLGAAGHHRVPAAALKHYRVPLLWGFAAKETVVQPDHDRLDLVNCDLDF